MCSRTAHFEHVNVESNFVTCGKILKYLRKLNLLQEDPDTLREFANDPEESGVFAELRNCTWSRLFRIFSGTLSVVETFTFFSVRAVQCISIFDGHFPMFPFNHFLVILPVGTEYPELQRVSFNVQLRC